MRNEPLAEYLGWTTANEAEPVWQTVVSNRYRWVIKSTLPAVSTGS
jgi:hypothetical protein